MERKVLKMRARKGLWLFEFDQTKYEPAFHYIAYIVLGLGSLLFGMYLGWTIYQQWNRDSVWSLLMALVAPVAMIAFGIIHFPLGVLYFVRRAKGEAVDVWSAELPDTTDASEKNHGPDNQ